MTFFFKILWPSQNIWTLKRQMIFKPKKDLFHCARFLWTYFPLWWQDWLSRLIFFCFWPTRVPPPCRQVVSLVSSRVCVCNNSNSYANIIYSPIGGGLAVFLSLNLIYCRESAKNEKKSSNPFVSISTTAHKLVHECMCKSAWKCQFELSSSNCAHNLP